MARRPYRGAVFTVVVALAVIFVVGEQHRTAEAVPQPTPIGYDVIFVRHAQASPSTGPLSEVGLAQAAALAEDLHGEPVNAVYTSMLLRAFQTGAAVATDRNMPLVADERINEMAFDLTGVPPAEINQVIGDRLRQWLEGENRDEGFGGESFNELHVRWDEWWTSFVDEHHTDKGLAVVVTHGALLMLMLPETCSNPIEPDFVLDHGLANTAIVRARLHPNRTLSCSEWAGTPIPSA